MHWKFFYYKNALEIILLLECIGIFFYIKNVLEIILL